MHVAFTMRRCDETREKERQRVTCTDKRFFFFFNERSSVAPSGASETALRFFFFIYVVKKLEFGFGFC